MPLCAGAHDHMKYRIQEILIDEEKEIDLKSDHNMIITKIKTKEHTTKRIIFQTTKNWKRKNVDWTKYNEEVDKARPRPISGNSKEEKINNTYKVVRWAGERSVGLV